LGEYDVSQIIRWPWNALLGSLLSILAARIVWRRRGSAVQAVS
jgi:hypothetical protein